MLLFNVPLPIPQHNIVPRSGPRGHGESDLVKLAEVNFTDFEEPGHGDVRHDFALVRHVDVVLRPLVVDLKDFNAPWREENNINLINY